MKNSTVSLILRADTAPFIDSIRQAEQEFSSRFKKMGSTSHAHSNHIKEDFTSISLGAKQFTNHLKQAAKHLTIMAGEHRRTSKRVRVATKNIRAPVNIVN